MHRYMELSSAITAYCCVDENEGRILYHMYVWFWSQPRLFMYITSLITGLEKIPAGYKVSN